MHCVFTKIIYYNDNIHQLSVLNSQQYWIKITKF